MGAKAKQAAKEKRPRGRPGAYSVKLVDEICKLVGSTDRGLHRLHKEFPSKVPHPSTLMRWLADKDKAYFREQYARARDFQADFLVDEMFEIADDRSHDDTAFTGINRVHRAKLQIEVRKWRAGKLAPKKYGDKLEIDGKMQTEQRINEADIANIAKKINGSK
jgi:hypothetical protein